MPNVDLATQRAAEKYDVRADILKKLIRQESGGNNKARSPAGARGIAQFIPSTAREYGVNLDDNRITDDLEGAAHYLSDNLKRTGGDYAAALSIYNSGKPDGYKHIPETAKYVRSILGGTTPTVGDTSSNQAQAASKGSTAGGSAARRQLVLAYLANTHAPNALQNLGLGLLEAKSSTGASAPSAFRAPKSGSGVVDFEGKKVSSGIAPLLEYARQRGWTGTVSSGYRSDAEQARIYDSGVRPAAKPQSEGGGGSNHSQAGWLEGAVDVTDPEVLSRILKAKHSRLKAAGAKDPPHFSFPRNGTY